LKGFYMHYYLPEHFPPEARNPAPNVWIIECFDEDWNMNIISLPDDWAYPLPEGVVPLGHKPLPAAGAIATLNVILGLWTLEDAANAVKVRPEDLIAEAETWAQFAD
jgi:hypothetical protein